MMSPLILSLPDINRRWGLAEPSTSLPKSSSERSRVTVATSQLPFVPPFSSTNPICASSPRQDGTMVDFCRSKEGVWQKRTSGLADTGANTAGLLEVDVPALRLASLVLEGEGKDTVGLLDGVLALGVGAGEDAVDDVESGRGRELG